MIEVHELTVRFGEHIAVDRVSFDVQSSEVVALVGGSGSGKTTTLKCINRLIEDPEGGSIRLAGKDVRSIPAHELRRSIGYCFQGVGLFPHLSVEQNVSITPRLLGWTAERIEKRVAELLEQVELEPARYLNRMPDQLSGGQRQRVGVARALAAKPRVVLFDEPFGALDALTRERLQESLLKLKRSMSLTAVFVTHDIVEAIVVADRIGIMREGRLLQIGTPRELLEEPADDYVTELMSTPKRHADALRTQLGAEG